MIGFNMADFIGEFADKCETDNPVKMIKLTTCQARDCTCNAIEKRCDQIVNCVDEYDEDNMKDKQNKLGQRQSQTLKSSAFWLVD